VVESEHRPLGARDTARAMSRENVEAVRRAYEVMVPGDGFVVS
jgi:hypothetical protein